MTQATEIQMDTSELIARLAVSFAIEKKAEKIVMFNPGKASTLADWFVICESDNPIHNRAIADGIIGGLRDHKLHVWKSEGLEDGRWVLVDYSDVVVNVMLPDVREMFNLEGIFKDATRYDIDEATFVAPVI